MKSTTLKYVGIMMGVAFLVMAQPSNVFAQEEGNEIDLESYLNDDSLVLEKTVTEKTPKVAPEATPDATEVMEVKEAAEPAPTVPLQTPTDVTSTDSEASAVVVNQGTADALPPVTNTRLRIETEGFDYTPTKNINTEFQLGGQDPTQKTQQELAEEIRQEAFDAAITGMFPLKPENIKDLIKEYDKTKRAVEEPVYGVPAPRVNVETVSLDPGVAPMIIHTATGHITTLNILDVTGAPWPVQDISWAGNFEVIEPEEGGHVVRITPMGQSAYGNMSIRLLTLKTPITIMLKTGKDEVQYRVDARIPEFGPFAQTPLIEGGSERVAGNALIMSVLDGTPPDGAEKLSVSGVDGRTTAYKIRTTTYVRTPLTLLSPGWEQSVSSADGMNVYALAETPVLLLSDRGRFMRASLNPGKDLFDE